MALLGFIDGHDVANGRSDRVRLAGAGPDYERHAKTVSAKESDTLRDLLACGAHT